MYLSRIFDFKINLLLIDHTFDHKIQCIRQRGVGNTNAIKLGRCIKELERIYGIRDGSAGKRSLDQNNLGLKTQDEIASEIGISSQQLRNYKKLTELIPEVQDLAGEKIVLNQK